MADVKLYFFFCLIEPNLFAILVHIAQLKPTQVQASQTPSKT
jgi:hypothetical protein